MTISSLSLSNFRNHLKRKFTFSLNTTIIIGKNTSGKTNLIEAIYFLSIGKSNRAGQDVQVITFGEELARIKGELKAEGENIVLEMVLTTGEVMGIKTPLKKFTVNDVSRRSLDFIGTLKSVLFWPEHMELVTDSPSLRRHYLDSVLVQVDREYRRTILSYERALRQRNRLLEYIKENKAHRHQLLFWDQLLIRQGNYITKIREEYINFINDFKLPQMEDLGVKYQVFYDKSIISITRLDQYREAEIGASVTLIGPQRDDMIFRIKKNEEYFDLSNYGSRGEQRLAVLWLKLAELAFIESKTSEEPVLLLDDIFSELDHEHREIIFGMIGNQQSIVTVTDRHLIPERYYKEAKVIELD
ncbi:hypothetical protein A3D78_04555 [Candidatus Gottesmanbacteria bacterium RIFCSPHIGHO2_02_FULL_39_14]|uniref:DNA replication and repair protein RecF n=1 Tax=Candidatus Gottesmanbacteria bacterium RIFCSPHIGHO2_02_FULL_39_14 TaxID=1798383 RepID=A0A1F6A332_9BACT|nr:MAG: hypothetical protein A3D78_04555 [Candidatus Gottesmanbacteria bacterium RIFCSPHIGHO2_02_FULL_39_14]